MTRPVRPDAKATTHVDDLWGYLAGDLTPARARADVQTFVDEIAKMGLLQP